MAATLLVRAIPLALFWWMLAGDNPASWILGGPVIVAAAVWPRDDRSAGRRRAADRIRPWRLPQFAAFFVWRSLAGGVDVAWRALHWRLPIAPVMRSYEFRLPRETAARVCFANCINLLPGTLAAAWEGDTLQIHVLADSPQTMRELAELERHVAALFGHRLPAGDNGGVI